MCIHIGADHLRLLGQVFVLAVLDIMQRLQTGGKHRTIPESMLAVPDRGAAGILGSA